MKRELVTCTALLLVGFAASTGAQRVAGQSGPGWVSLFDGKAIGAAQIVGGQPRRYPLISQAAGRIF